MGSKIAVVDRNIHPKGAKILGDLGLHIIYSVENKKLSGGISTHPDMQLLPLENNTVLVAGQCYDYYLSKLSPFGVKVIKFDCDIFSPYPFDALLNAAPLFNKYLFVSKYSYEKLKGYFGGFTPVFVKQGYTKCSICSVAENALITSDMGIYTAANKLGVDVLYVNPLQIKLSGFSHGLFGGCTGLVDSNTMFINGSLEGYDKVLGFLRKYGVRPVYSTEYELCDIGSVIII